MATKFQTIILPDDRGIPRRRRVYNGTGKDVLCYGADARNGTDRDGNVLVKSSDKPVGKLNKQTELKAKINRPMVYYMPVGFDISIPDDH